MRYLSRVFAYCKYFCLTTVFVDMRLCKTKHPRKCFQNFRQSYVLLTDGLEIHQLQPLVWPSNLLYVMLLGCDWWVSIWSVNNMQDWRKFWKHFRGCFVLQSRVSTKTVVNLFTSLPPFLLIHDFGKQNTRENVSKISVSLACYWQIGSKSTNHSQIAWRREG